MTKPNGKTALVTGSTDGVGRVVAEMLAAAGWRVLVHGRDRERGERVVAADQGRRRFRRVSRGRSFSLAEVRRLADAVQNATSRLDLLINNAGIGSGGPQGTRQTSAEGHELRFAVNYLAGFLLTYLLLRLIKKSAPARIVNVSSLGQEPIAFDDVMLTKGYSGMRAYRQSKLAQIMFTIDLAGELEGTGVTVNALHPATFMNTRDGDAIRRQADVHRPGRRRRHLQARRVRRNGRPDGSLFQRTKRSLGEPASLRRRSAAAAQGR